MAVKEKKKNSAMYQMLGLSVLLLLLISVSTVATLVLTGTVEVSTNKGSAVTYIVDAEKLCERRMKADYGNEISTLAVDDRSSFFDEPGGRYKLHYQLELFRNGAKQSGVNLFYVNCEVTASSGDIRRIEYLEQLEFKPKAVRRETGNAFGF